ncbi:hypothetical protein TREMEDRAFT_34237 [Tremella mesenterica DSM 1558]|uniref:uncharacterized protein n=1 Tax=Tremella mesenterica (strain ATCC 24925 / CBS 8224 / DSM 1558 / NBRC 9311 / NRRL Y-6157 / RJB 2259-6 / UBC 559-6) TaxID=578456 RepID=UPI0003F49DF5|nr:uncharacterized protein TREMEDRAFT_34237 [Tremella mesenterica DSM 1558]EIW66960.1 hypothetical protein TREMEDRAFT_34237 [Tremella mesenterica DSM 1558]
MPIGPTLPPHLARPTSESGDEDEDDYGPSLPPHLLAARNALSKENEDSYGPTSYPSIGPSRSSSSSKPSIGPIGPSRPSLDRRETDDEDDDDEIGPKPDHTPGVEKSAVEEFLEREKRRNEALEDDDKPKKPKREEWMLVPPTSGVLASVDPLRKRPTTFNRSSKITEVDTTWTETPAERIQREQDELAGVQRKRDPVHVPGGAGEDVRKRRRDEEVAEEIKRHNKEIRGPSLMEQHSKKPKKEEEHPVIWDREKMLGVGGRLLSESERAQKIKDAKGLNDRFGHSKQGAFSI